MTAITSKYGFERVSPEQFVTDCKKLININTVKMFNIKEGVNLSNIEDDYEKIIKLPERSTKNSAGYDFFLPDVFDIDLSYGSLINNPIVIPTGIKCKMPSGCFLGIYPRSSFGIKKGIYLANTVGIIDSDYYDNNDNEGHIMIALNVRENKEGNKILAGEKFVQGILQPYLTFGDEVDIEREGGIGSTTKVETVNLKY